MNVAISHLSILSFMGRRVAFVKLALMDQNGPAHEWRAFGENYPHALWKCCTLAARPTYDAEVHLWPAASARIFNAVAASNN